MGVSILIAGSALVALPTNDEVMRTMRNNKRTEKVVLMSVQGNHSQCQGKATANFRWRRIEYLVLSTLGVLQLLDNEPIDSSISPWIVRRAARLRIRPAFI